MHYSANFSSDPKIEYVEAVEYLLKYLAGTQEKGLIMNPTSQPLLEVYTDANVIGNWYRSTARDDANTAKLQTGFVLTFAKDPIL